MGLQDVAFVPSRASFYITFIKNYRRGKSFGTSTYLQTAIGSKQCHLATLSFGISADLKELSVIVYIMRDTNL